jgi:hypothetical protein
MATDLLTQAENLIFGETDINSPPSTNLWTEPESAANTVYQPVYPYNHVTQTEFGHSFEMDDTPTRERVRISHGAGSFIELHPNGDNVTKVFGNGYEIHLANKNVMIKGVCNITIEGDCNMDVKGDYGLQVGGDYKLLVKGAIDMRSHQDTTIQSDQDVAIKGNEEFGGAVRFSAADHLFLDADLVVGGSISADIINSKTRVNAGTGVYAGPLGFVSGTGGLSLGVPTPVSPVAVPGQIFALGTITSLMGVEAPTGTFGIIDCGFMDAILMTDMINSGIYDTHIHATGVGPSSPPVVPFLGV